MHQCTNSFFMRLSVNLKEEYYEAVRAYSKAENVSLSQALNRLLATAFQRSCPPTNEGERTEPHFPTSRGARKVTSALIDALETDA